MTDNTENAYLLVLSTCPDQACAQAVAEKIVDAGLGACVNIVPDIRSVYQWQGTRESAAECLIVIKTRKTLYGRLETLLVESHPYELPEVIAVPIERGLPAYLRWISDNTDGK